MEPNTEALLSQYTQHHSIQYSLVTYCISGKNKNKKTKSNIIHDYNTIQEDVSVGIVQSGIMTQKSIVLVFR